MKFGEEKVLHEANLAFDVVDGDGFEGSGCRQNGGNVRCERTRNGLMKIKEVAKENDSPCVLYPVCVVQPVLQQVKRYAERSQAKFLV